MFVIYLVLSCICLINARTINEEHTFGDTNNKVVFGTQLVEADVPHNNPMEWYSKYEFTFPEVWYYHWLFFIDKRMISNVLFLKILLNRFRQIVALLASNTSTTIHWPEYSSWKEILAIIKLPWKWLQTIV